MKSIGVAVYSFSCSSLTLGCLLCVTDQREGTQGSVNVYSCNLVGIGHSLFISLGIDTKGPIGMFT